MDRVEQQDSTPQNDSTLGFKWIKKSHEILCSHIFIIHNDHTCITGDYTKLCLNIICNRSFFLFWNDVSVVPVRVLHKDEKILGGKHIYLPHAQTAIYDSKVKLFLKQGISGGSHQLGRDAVVRFEYENSAIDAIINFLWKIFHKPIDHRTCGFDHR
jgi:hypothetical protein